MIARTFAATLALALAGALFVAAAPQDGGTTTVAAPRAELKIGVVDLKQCFDSAKYDRIRDEERKYKSFVEVLSKEVDDAENAVAQKDKEIESARNIEELRNQFIQERGVLAYKAKMITEINKQKAMNEYQRVQMDIYNGIRAVIEEYGKANDFDMIFKIDEPMLDEGSVESVSKRINNRPVLFHSADLDITVEVLKKLNEAYRK